MSLAFNLASSHSVFLFRQKDVQLSTTHESNGCVCVYNSCLLRGILAVSVCALLARCRRRRWTRQPVTFGRPASSVPQQPMGLLVTCRLRPRPPPTRSTPTVTGSRSEPRLSLLSLVAFLIGLVCVNAGYFFQFRVSNTHGHSYELYQQFSNCTSRSKFFSERVVTLWNSLPGDRVNFSSLHIFKPSLKSTDLMSLVH